MAVADILGVTAGTAGDSHYGFDDLRRDLGNDCVACETELMNSSEKPINQKTNSGFNAPFFSVGSPSPLHAS